MMFKPAGNVARYLPKRSTMPALACGTMRTDLNSTMAAKRTITPRTMSSAYMAQTLSDRTSATPYSADALRDWKHDGGRTIDFRNSDLLAGFDDRELVDRASRPNLTAQLDLTGVLGDALEDQGALADERVRAAPQSWSGVQPVYDVRAHERQQRH